MGTIRTPRDVTLASMTKNELVLTGRLAAHIIRSEGDTNPEATSDLLDALTDRLEES